MVHCHLYLDLSGSLCCSKKVMEREPLHRRVPLEGVRLGGGERSVTLPRDRENHQSFLRVWKGRPGNKGDQQMR